jgi:RNA polymerase sigma-70 factor (ECF subfamily)
MDASLTEHSEERLIKAALDGDDGAFAQLVTRHKRRVFCLASRFTRDYDELEDICQDVFIKAFEHLGKFRHSAPFEHWLSRITVHTCYDALRKRRNEKYHRPLDDVAYEISDTAAEARRESREAREVLEWAMARIKPEERLVITLMELEEKTVRETADLTGWSETNVKVRAHRARQSLKKILEASDAR